MNLVEFWGTKIKPKVVKGKNMLYPIQTGKINENIYAVRDKDVNMFIYKSKDQIIAVDSGYKNSEYLKREFKKIDISNKDISHVFLTHTDLDHAGGLDVNSGSYFPNHNIYLGKIEEKHLKKQVTRAKILFLKGHVPVDIGNSYNLLEDGQIIRIGNIKIEAILVPGHTVGHMCYLVDNKYLFTGDSIVLYYGKAHCFYDTWNIDSNQLMKSLKKIQKLKGVQMVFTSHNGYTTNFEKAVEVIGEPLKWNSKNFKGQTGAPYDPYL